MASGPITSWIIKGEKRSSDRFFFPPWAPESLQMVTAAMKFKKMVAPWKDKDSV